MTLANFITLTRFLLIPYIVQSMVYDCWEQAFVLFGFAAITDFLDGRVARWLKAESMLGKILDPIADKCLVLAVMYALSFYHHLVYLPSSFVLFFLCKELFFNFWWIIIIFD